MPDALKGSRGWVLAGVLVALVAGGITYALTRPDKVEVPDVVGQQVGIAEQAVEEEGFEVETDLRTDDAPADAVIEQDPEGGEEADEGSTVNLVVSSGPGSSTVPKVEGLSQSAATASLTEAGFEPQPEQAFSDTVPKGKAIGTEPPAGTEAEIGVITLLVSKGPNTVAIPALIGLSAQEALARLRAEQLVGQIVMRQSLDPAGRVFDHAPPAGQAVKRGSTVTVFVAEPGVVVPDVFRQTENEARVTLGEAGLEVAVKYVKVPRGSRGLVIAQSPDAGSRLQAGDTVTISVGSHAPGIPVGE